MILANIRSPRPTPQPLPHCSASACVCPSLCHNPGSVKAGEHRRPAWSPRRRGQKGGRSLPGALHQDSEVAAMESCSRALLPKTPSLGSRALAGGGGSTLPPSLCLCRRSSTGIRAERGRWQLAVTLASGCRARTFSPGPAGLPGVTCTDRRCGSLRSDHCPGGGRGSGHRCCFAQQLRATQDPAGLAPSLVRFKQQRPRVHQPPWRSLWD